MPKISQNQYLNTFIYVLILTYFWHEHLILWGTENLKSSTFGGFCEERGEYIHE